MDILRSNLTSISTVVESMERNIQFLRDNLTTSEGDIDGTALAEKLQTLSGNDCLMFKRKYETRYEKTGIRGF